MANQTKESDAFFDHFSSGDKPTKAGAGLVRALARKIFKYAGVAPGGSVLEIGPGRGDFADICLKAGIEYSAIEANRQMAESLQARGAHVVRAMAPPLPALDKRFDTVVMINVMEHMNDVRDALAITGQIRDVLKPKGKFVVCSPDYLNWRRDFFNCDFSHNYVTTRRRLEQLLVNCGFGNIKSCHLSGPVSGLLCFLLSAFVSRLPFGFLNAAFPDSKLCYKLYKGQLTFLRKVLVVGEKQS
jgi:SAM-dependent methyltransferase